MPILNPSTVEQFRNASVDQSKLNKPEFQKFQINNLLNKHSRAKDDLNEFVEIDQKDDPYLVNIMNQINDILNSFINIFNDIKVLENNIENWDAATVANSVNTLVARLDTEVLHRLSSLLPYLNYIQFIKLNTTKQSKELTTVKSEVFALKKDYSQFLVDSQSNVAKFFEEWNSKFQSTIESLKEERRKELADEYISFFEKIAEGKTNPLQKHTKKYSFAKLRRSFFLQFRFTEMGYKQYYCMWRNRTIFTIILLILVGIGYEFYINNLIKEIINNSNESMNTLNIYFFSARVILYTVFGYLIFMFNRNYSNNRHLYNIYKQKALNLRTYKSFIDTLPDDSELRKEVSLKVAQTIFEAVETGYINQNDGVSIIDTFTNIVRK